MEKAAGEKKVKGQRKAVKSQERETWDIKPRWTEQALWWLFRQ